MSVKLIGPIAQTECARGCGEAVLTQVIPGAEDLAGICGDCLTSEEKHVLLSALGPEAVSRALLQEIAGAGR